MSSRILQPRRTRGITNPLESPNNQILVVHFSGFHASIYHAKFPSYLSTIQNEGINDLKSKFKNPLPLHHTILCNLIHPDSHLQFLKNFVAIIRCLADGKEGFWIIIHRSCMVNRSHTILLAKYEFLSQNEKKYRVSTRFKNRSLVNYYSTFDLKIFFDENIDSVNLVL